VGIPYRAACGNWLLLAAIFGAPGIGEKPHHYALGLIPGQIFRPEERLQAQTVQQPNKHAVHCFRAHLQFIHAIAESVSQHRVQLGQTSGAKFSESLQGLCRPNYVETELDKEKQEVLILDELDIVVAHFGDSFRRTGLRIDPLLERFNDFRQLMLIHGKQKIFFVFKVRIKGTATVAGFPGHCVDGSGAEPFSYEDTIGRPNQLGSSDFCFFGLFVNGEYVRFVECLNRNLTLRMTLLGEQPKIP
jgi:hypothetical protein